MAIRPKRGKSIPEGRYDYIKTENGLPAMRAIWKGSLFSSEERIFAFSEHATKFSEADDETSRGLAKHSKQTPFLMPGIVGAAARLGADAIRASMINTSDTKGFVFHYINEVGHTGMCWAIAPAAFVGEILASVPADKIDRTIVPKVTSR